MRLLVAALAGFTLAVVPALGAADQTVTASGISFSPKTVEITQGETVTWTKGEGNHNVHFDDASIGNLGSVGTNTPSYRFDKPPGTYTYVCDPHKDLGMSGSVVVKAASTTGTTTQTTTTTTTATTTTTTTTAPPTTTTITTATTTTATTEAPPPAPVVSVKPLRSRFCFRAGRICSRAGVYLRITSDTPHRAVARIRRNGKAFGTVAFDLPAGTKYVRFRRTGSGKRLTRGRYWLKLGSAPGVRFRII